MPKIAEAFPAGSIIRDAALHNPMGASWFQATCETIMATILERSDNGRKRATWRAHEKHRDQADEIIAIAPWSGQNDANDQTQLGHLRAKVTLSRFQIDLC